MLLPLLVLLLQLATDATATAAATVAAVVAGADDVIKSRDVIIKKSLSESHRRLAVDNQISPTKLRGRRLM